MLKSCMQPQFKVYDILWNLFPTPCVYYVKPRLTFMDILDYGLNSFAIVLVGGLDVLFRNVLNKFPKKTFQRIETYLLTLKDLFPEPIVDLTVGVHG
eukprot:snap_masked-scaffold_25-processed-gene-4.42-mRNA-1 protein AED:1.00 eAED:1.00 QI:0/0/0/0/1/1/2/0/96